MAFSLKIESFQSRIQAVCDFYQRNPIEAERSAMTLLTSGVQFDLIDDKVKEILTNTKIAPTTPFDIQRKLALSKDDKKTRLAWMRQNETHYHELFPLPKDQVDCYIEAAEDEIAESSEASSSRDSTPPEWQDIDDSEYKEFVPAAQVFLNKQAYLEAFSEYKARYFGGKIELAKAQRALDTYLDSLISLAKDTQKLEHFTELAQFTLPKELVLPECYKKEEYETWIAAKAADATNAATKIFEMLNREVRTLSIEEYAEKLTAQVQQLSNAADKFAKAGQNGAALHILKAIYTIAVPSNVARPEAMRTLSLITRIVNLDESEGKALLTTHIRKTVAGAFIQDAHHFYDAIKLAKTFWGEGFLTAEMHFYEALLVEAPGKGVDRDLKKFEEHINKAIAKAPNVYLYYEYPYRVFLSSEDEKATEYQRMSVPHFKPEFATDLWYTTEKFLEKRNDPKNYMQGCAENDFLQKLLSGEEVI